MAGRRERARHRLAVPTGDDGVDELSDGQAVALGKSGAEVLALARATVEDGPESVRVAGIRPTHTPAVLITRGSCPRSRHRVHPCLAPASPESAPMDSG